ncbi:Rho GTPase-activating protein 5-like protein [Tanacetum coccineum]
MFIRLAGLIKHSYTELPTGILDSLTPEQVMHCNTEENCSRLVKYLPQTEVALLDWAINLMADVVKYEPQNKMNAHNIAMVFTPNTTQVHYCHHNVFFSLREYTIPQSDNADGGSFDCLLKQLRGRGMVAKPARHSDVASPLGSPPYRRSSPLAKMKHTSQFYDEATRQKIYTL